MSAIMHVKWQPGDHGWYWHRTPKGPRRIHVTVRTVSYDLLRVVLPNCGPITVRTIEYSRLRSNAELPAHLRR